MTTESFMVGRGYSTAEPIFWHPRGLIAAMKNEVRERKAARGGRHAR